MLLDGVSVDDRVVRELAAILERPLAEKLDRALFFSAEIVALSRDERSAVLAALDRMPLGYDDVRDRLLASDRWREPRIALV